MRDLSLNELEIVSGGNIGELMSSAAIQNTLAVGGGAIRGIVGYNATKRVFHQPTTTPGYIGAGTGGAAAGGLQILSNYIGGEIGGLTGKFVSFVGGTAAVVAGVGVGYAAEYVANAINEKMQAHNAENEAALNLS